MENYKETLKYINTFCFDYDGVFTNGVMMLLSNGEIARTAHVRDGYAVQLASKKGYNIVIITGGTQEAVKTRFEGLGVDDVFLGAHNKLAVFERYMLDNRIDPSRVCYMGDDIPDYEVMALPGLPSCPKDAVPEIKSRAKYISPYNGGEGCVRDIIEQVLKAQGKWMDRDAMEW
jgi:3-deoxy-D-manno-octulosonate 8-phosphate phosphatase (KDO 8-P phosphatase)